MAFTKREEFIDEPPIFLLVVYEHLGFLLNYDQYPNLYDTYDQQIWTQHQSLGGDEQYLITKEIEFEDGILLRKLELQSQSLHLFQIYE